MALDTSKIIHAPVGGGRYTVTAPIVKEDYGLYLKIEGLELPATYEVDFSNDEHSGSSVTMIGNADGVLIPSQFIKSGKDVFAFLYHVGEDYGRTIFKFRIPNKLRPDRTDEQPTPEEQSVIDQTISALNDAVEEAQGYAQTASDKADSIHDMTATAQTLPEGSEATASYDAETGVMSFGIPVGATGAKGDKGDKGDTGERGTGVLKVTTAPTSYTTQTGGFTPKFRIALSTVQSQAYVDEVLIGDVISHSYNLYNVGYVDDTYAYLSAATSIRGAKGTTGAQGPAGSDASVTSANIESALGYMPVSKSSVNASVNGLINKNAEKGYVLTYDSTVSESKPYPWRWAPAPVGTTLFPISSNDSAGIYYVVSQLKAAADNSGVASMSVPFEAGSAFLSNISDVYGANKVPIILIRGASPNPIIRYLAINNLWAESPETGISGAEMGYWDGLYHIEIVIGTSTLTIIVEKKG